ncbi:Hypothetical predicted protein, partial [Pelobates cultripes]
MEAGGHASTLEAVWGTKAAAKKEPDRTSPTTHTLHVWNKVRRANHISPSPSPMIPLTNNRSVGGGLTARAWGILGEQEQDYVPFRNVLDDTNLKPLSELTNTQTPTPQQSFRYTQLRHFYHSFRDRAAVHRALTPFEKLCLTNTSIGRAISYLYQYIFTGDRTEMLTFKMQWEHITDHEFTPNQWEKILILHHKSS